MPSTETTDTTKCVAHGTPTLLRCAQCETPVCPKCAVWTEVGQKCPTCSGRKHVSGLRRHAPALVLGGGVVLLVLGLLYLGSDAFQGSDTEPMEVEAPGAMGEEVSDGRLSFTVDRFECADQTLEYEGERAAANGTYCFVTVQVRNDGRREAVFFGGVQYLIDSSGRRYDVDPVATGLYLRPTPEQIEEEDFFFASELGPGEDTAGVLVFDVADDAEIIEIELHAADLGALDGISPPVGRGVKVTLKQSPATSTTSGPIVPVTSPSTPAPASGAPGADGT